MTQDDNRCRGKTKPTLCALADELPTYQPTIDNNTIFRELISDEIRNGRLTPSRRRRIVRYAARLDMTPVQAGRMISNVRRELLRGDDPSHRRHALRLVGGRDDAKRDRKRLLLAFVLIVDLCALVLLLL